MIKIINKHGKLLRDQKATVTCMYVRLDIGLGNYPKCMYSPHSLTLLKIYMDIHYENIVIKYEILLNNKWLIHIFILSFGNIWFECSEIFIKLDFLFTETLLTGTTLRGMSEIYEYVKKWAMLKCVALVWMAKGETLQSFTHFTSYSD